MISFSRIIAAVTGLVLITLNAWADIPVSEATSECLECHTAIHPGIVEGWAKSRHAKITPKEALSADELALKVSSKSMSYKLSTTPKKGKQKTNCLNKKVGFWIWKLNPKSQ